MNKQLIDIITRVLDEYPWIGAEPCLTRELLAEKITASIDEEFDVHKRSSIIKNEPEQVLFDFNGIE